MSEIVYRVQDKHGRGPFKPGFTQQWADEEFALGMKALPTWMEEFGGDLVEKNGKHGEFFGSAVRTREEVGRWFSATEQARLRYLGFRIVGIKIDRVLAESNCQLVFARRRPLARKVIVVPWPILMLRDCPAEQREDDR